MYGSRTLGVALVFFSIASAAPQANASFTWLQGYTGCPAGAGTFGAPRYIPTNWRVTDPTGIGANMQLVHNCYFAAPKDFGKWYGFKTGWRMQYRKKITPSLFTPCTPTNCWAPKGDPVPPPGFGGGNQDNGNACFISPLIIDMAGNGLNPGPAGRGINYDLNANGRAELVQWVSSGGDDAFLALDRDGDGLPTTGAELFGEGTPLWRLGGTPSTDGFEGLSQYDSPELGGNSDGIIDANDYIWSQLLLWNDQNADGVPTHDEVSYLSDSFIEKLDTSPNYLNEYDASGNWIPLSSKAYGTIDGIAVDRAMVDVFFKSLE